MPNEVMHEEMKFSYPAVLRYQKAEAPAGGLIDSGEPAGLLILFHIIVPFLPHSGPPAGMLRVPPPTGAASAAIVP